MTHFEDDATNLHYVPSLGRSDHAVLVFDFHIVVISVDVSAQSRRNVLKANIQDNIHSVFSVDWSVTPESLIEAA